MIEGLERLLTDRWQLNLSQPQQGLVDDLLLESNGHALFVKEELIKADGQQLTVGECFAAYVEYCTNRGWVTLSRNKFGQVVVDEVARSYGITLRHDIREIGGGRAQRGWNGLGLRREF
jgi:phage/plasmid-associated DNA primase